METMQLESKKLLKLRKPQDVVIEINELESVKSAYKHYLASYNATENSNTSDYVTNNLEVVKANIKALHDELLKIRSLIKTVVSQKPVVVRNLMHNDDEIAAIRYFNSDKRFTITE